MLHRVLLAAAIGGCYNRRAMGLEIQIIGKGCYFCKQLRKMVDELVQELGVAEVHVDQTADLEALLGYGVVNPPALVVNRKLKLMGRVLLRSRVRQAIEEEMGQAVPSPAADSSQP